MQAIDFLGGGLVAVFLAGVLIGLVAGIVGTAFAFLRVFKTKYVIPDDEMQAELASIIEEREVSRERRATWRELDDQQKRERWAQEEAA